MTSNEVLTRQSPSHWSREYHTTEREREWEGGREERERVCVREEIITKEEIEEDEGSLTMMRSECKKK